MFETITSRGARRKPEKKLEKRALRYKTEEENAIGAEKREENEVARDAGRAQPESGAWLLDRMGRRLGVFCLILSATAIASPAQKDTPASDSATFAVSLNGTTGAYPTAALVLGADGNFYGTAYGGGENDSGTGFRSPQPENLGGPYLQASETNFGPGLDLIFGTNWNRFFDFGGL